MIFRLSLVLACFCIAPLRAQIAVHYTDTTVQRLHQQDDLENFTYTIINRYRAEPTVQQLALFDTYEHQAWRPQTSPAEHLAYVILLCNKAYYHARFGDLYRAVATYEKAWKLFSSQQLSGYDITAYCLKPLARAYRLLDDFPRAETAIKRYLALSDTITQTAPHIDALVDLAILHHDTKHYDQAIVLLRQALTLHTTPLPKRRSRQPQRPGNLKDKLGILYLQLATNYLALEDVTTARRYALSSLDAIRQHVGADSVVQMANTYFVLSSISLTQNRTNEALFFAQTARGFAEWYTDRFPVREVALYMNRCGEILLMKGRHREAIRAYRKALGLLLPGYDPTKAGTDLPEPSEYYADTALKDALDGLAAVYMETGQPVKVLECFDHSFAVEDLLRITYTTPSERRQQQEAMRQRTEWALGVLYTLLTRTSDVHYSERAFALAERTRAVILRHVVEDDYVQQQLGQDTLIIQERRLSYMYTTVAIMLATEQQRGKQVDAFYKRQLVNLQASLKGELQTVRRAIEANYPAQLPVAVPRTDVAALKRRSERQHAILMEYFMGKESGYVFRIDRDTLLFRILPDVDEIRKNVTELNNLFADSTALRTRVATYTRAAHALYRLLRLPEDQAPKTLIIIPDGVLYSVPFDALLYEKAVGAEYESFPYLLKRYTITFQPSACLYLRGATSSQPLNRYGLLALFPPLQHSGATPSYAQAEAEAVDRYMGGEFLYDKGATRQAFLEESANYSLAHLAADVTLKGNDGDVGFLMADTVMYLADVYGLALDTDLLVLSSCGVGAGWSGMKERALHLSRGMQLAGIRNVVFSLWRTNNTTAAMLMEKFYARYTATGSKARALQEARLTFLEDPRIAPLRKSPYYWAGFVYYGSAETQYVPDDPAIRQMLLPVGGIVALLGIVMYVWWRRRRILP